MAKKDRLTPGMIDWLKALAAGNNPTAHFRTSAQYGGSNGTVYALKRRGLIDRAGEITTAGRDAIPKEKT